VGKKLPKVGIVIGSDSDLEVMREAGLQRGKKGLQVMMMCEIPSNAILAEESP